MSNEKEYDKLSSQKKLSILNQWRKYMAEIYPIHDIIEKVIYSHLFWISIGIGKRECQISYSDLKKVTKIKADYTFTKHINSLRKKRHLKLLKRGFNTPSIYRVYSPLEILNPDKFDKKKKRGE